MSEKGPDRVDPSVLEAAKKSAKEALCGPETGRNERDSLACTVLENADIKVVFQHKFGPGKIEVRDSDKLFAGLAGDMGIDDQNKSYYLTGSTDRTPFDDKVSREKPTIEVQEYEEEGQKVELNWYDKMSGTAADFLTLKDHIDYSSFGFTPEEETQVLAAIQAISDLQNTGRARITQEDFEFYPTTDAGWNDMMTAGGFSKESVYGEKGALNLLTAFDHATVGIGDGLTKEDFGKDALCPAKIKVLLAKKSGNRPEDRYGVVLEMPRKKIDKIDEAEERRKSEEVYKIAAEKAFEEDPTKVLSTIIDMILKSGVDTYGVKFSTDQLRYDPATSEARAAVIHNGDVVGYIAINKKDIVFSLTGDPLLKGMYLLEDVDHNKVGPDDNPFFEGRFVLLIKDAILRSFNHVLIGSGYEIGKMEITYNGLAKTELMYDGKLAGYLSLYLEDVARVSKIEATSPESERFFVSTIGPDNGNAYIDKDTRGATLLQKLDKLRDHNALKENLSQ